MRAWRCGLLRIGTGKTLWNPWQRGFHAKIHLIVGKMQVTDRAERGFQADRVIPDIGHADTGSESCFGYYLEYSEVRARTIGHSNVLIDLVQSGAETAITGQV